MSATDNSNPNIPTNLNSSVDLKFTKEDLLTIILSKKKEELLATIETLSAEIETIKAEKEAKKEAFKGFFIKLLESLNPTSSPW